METRNVIFLVPYEGFDLRNVNHSLNSPMFSPLKMFVMVSEMKVSSCERAF